MHIPEIDPITGFGPVAAHLRDYGGFILRNAFREDALNSIRYSLECLRQLFDDPTREVLRMFPYDPATEAGYAPPGSESIRGTPVTNKHNYNYVRSARTFMRRPLDGAYEALEAMGQQLLGAYDQEVGTDVSSSIGERHILQATQYLNSRKVPRKVLMAAHRDFDLLTFFVGNGEPGLEVLEADGKTWCRPDLALGDVLVGAGTMLRGLCPSVRALPHRVVAEVPFRISLTFLLEPAPDTQLLSGELAGEAKQRIKARAAGK